MKKTRYTALVLAFSALLLSSCTDPNPSDPVTTDGPAKPPIQSEETGTSDPTTDQGTDPVTDPITDPPITPIESTSAPDTVPPETDPPVTFIPTDDYPAEYAYGNYDFNALFPGTVLGETEMADDEYRDGLVFLGDSTTYGMMYYDILTDSQVWVPKNGTLTMVNVQDAKIWVADENAEMTFTDALARKKPKTLIVTLGVNGISWMGETSFKNEYRKILDAVKTYSPDTVVIAQTIFPVTPKYKLQESINNKKISQANVWIAEVAVEYEIPFLNTASILLNEHGYLKDGSDSGDGMHLMPAVYREILQYVLTHRV